MGRRKKCGAGKRGRRKGNKEITIASEKGKNILTYNTQEHAHEARNILRAFSPKFHVSCSMLISTLPHLSLYLTMIFLILLHVLAITNPNMAVKRSQLCKFPSCKQQLSQSKKNKISKNRNLTQITEAMIFPRRQGSHQRPDHMLRSLAHGYPVESHLCVLLNNIRGLLL
jgi:hypothetical protein